MLASQYTRSSDGAQLRFVMYQSAGRATFTRFLYALAKIQKKAMIRFLPNGIVEFTQQPDVSNKIAHIWINSNREVFGFDDYHSTWLVLEIPVRPLLSIMKASESQDTIRFEFKEGSQSKLIISAGSEFITFTSTSHELPVVLHRQMESAFREPLISRPAITFAVPSIASLHDKLARLVKYSPAITIAANHASRLLFSVKSTLLNSELVFPSIQLIRSNEAVPDPLELLEIGVSLESLVRVLGCTGSLQGQVLCAICPKESIIFSAKIPNPCGPDRPAGTLSLILAAYDA